MLPGCAETRKKRLFRQHRGDLLDCFLDAVIPLRALEASQHGSENGETEYATGHEEELALPEADMEEAQGQLAGTEDEDAEDDADAEGDEEELGPVFRGVLWSAGEAREELAVHDHGFPTPLLDEGEHFPLEDERDERLERNRRFPLDDGTLLVDLYGDFDGFMGERGDAHRGQYTPPHG